MYLLKSDGSTVKKWYMFSCVSISAEQDEESGQVNVVVVFSHPTQLSMVPCKFYMEGSCKFSTDRCKYSHGQSVDFLDLGEFRSPDYSQIKSNIEGTKILALDPEAEGHQRLWKHASLVQYENEQKVSEILRESLNLQSALYCVPKYVLNEKHHL